MSTISTKTIYNATTGEYSQEAVEDEPVIEQDTRTLSDVQSAHQAANCDALAVYLAAHPITWADGEKYGVTLDDQQLMLLNLSTYKMGLTSELKWNSPTKKCRVFTEEEFGLLTAAIDAFVRPRVERCQDYKEQIFQAQTIQEVEAITFDFDDV